jgi:hypothetical protein
LTRFVWLNAAAVAFAAAAMVLLGDAWTDRSRRFVVTVMPTGREGLRHVVWLWTRLALFGGFVVAVGYATDLVVYSPGRRLESLVLVVMAVIVELAVLGAVIAGMTWCAYGQTPQRRRERCLVQRVWNDPVPGKSVRPEHVLVVGSFAGVPGPGVLLILSRKLLEFADTHRCALVAVARTYDRVKRYEGIGKFEQVFTYPDSSDEEESEGEESGEKRAPSEWYLVRYPQRR